MQAGTASGGLQAGSELEAVLLSGPYDGLLRVWRSDGRAEVRHLENAAPEFRDSIGRGVLARTSPEQNRYREVALLDTTADVIAFMGRAKIHPDGTVAETPATTVLAPKAAEP